MLVSYSIGLKFFYISGLNKMHADTHLKKWSIHMNIEFSKRADRFGSNIFNILNEKKNDRLAQGKPVYNFTVGTPDFKPDESVMKVVSDAALDPENYKYSLGDTDELLDAVCNGTNAVTTLLSHLMKSPLYSEPRKVWLILPLLCAIREIYA